MAKREESPSQDTFESALQELESIVRALERGDAPLEESLAAYERGVTLLRRCQETLTAAESRLRILEDGNLREAGDGELGRQDD